LVSSVLSTGSRAISTETSGFASSPHGEFAFFRS
jgi:hypothetical protein